MPAPARPAPAILEDLFAVVKSRKRAKPDTSYTAQLLQRGVPRIAQKLGEGTTELVIEAVLGNKKAICAESADLLYHLCVLWAASGVTPQQVGALLQKRLATSGLAEKAARKKGA